MQHSFYLKIISHYSTGTELLICIVKLLNTDTHTNYNRRKTKKAILNKDVISIDFYIMYVPVVKKNLLGNTLEYLFLELSSTFPVRGKKVHELTVL